MNSECNTERIRAILSPNRNVINTSKLSYSALKSFFSFLEGGGGSFLQKDKNVVFTSDLDPFPA